jgi:glycosyltransferase involved in cell wall biosynthesis
VNYLRDRYGSAATHVQRIYNGLDLEMYSYRSPEKRNPLILSVGRLVEKKGFEDVLKACAILSRNGTDYKCLIIGEGYLESVLRAQIQQLGLQSRVELLGPKPELEVIEYMRRAAVFALPCVVSGDQDRDGLPNVIFESMALGTPCVSTDVAGIPEILKHEKTGLLVPQRNPDALAAAIQRLLDDANLRSCIAIQARALIESEFDVRRNAALRRDLFWPAHKEQSSIAKEVS